MLHGGSLSLSEQAVVHKLASGLDYKKYFIFNNLILPLRRGGGTTQIDHIVVSQYGIFVAEIKDYAGRIFAGKDDKVWTQTLLGKQNNKNPFQNPLRQNYGHVKALEDRLSLPREYFHNIVVFSERCEFKTPRIENVLYLSEVSDVIKRFQEPKIGVHDLVSILGKLSYMCQTVDITTEEHIKNIREMHA